METDLLHQRCRHARGVLERGLLVDGLRHEVLHAGEIRTQRMLHPVAQPCLRGRGQRDRLHDHRIQCFVDVVAGASGHDGAVDRRHDRHRVAAVIGGGAAHGLQRSGIVGGPGDDERHPPVCVTSGRAQHPGAVRSHPDLRPLALVRRQIEDGVPQREVRRVPRDRFAVRLPQRPDRRQRLDEPRDGLRPLHPVRLVAFTFTDTDPEDGATAGEQMQGRGRLRGDRGVPTAGIGDADPEAQPAHPVARRQMAEHRPRLQDGVDLGHQLRRQAEVLGGGDRPRDQRVDVVAHPEGVGPGGRRGQHAGRGQQGRRDPRVHDAVEQSETKSGRLRPGAEHHGRDGTTDGRPRSEW